MLLSCCGNPHLGNILCRLHPSLPCSMRHILNVLCSSVRDLHGAGGSHMCCLVHFVCCIVGNGLGILCDLQQFDESSHVRFPYAERLSADHSTGCIA